MELTRQQQINQMANVMVNQLNAIATDYNETLTTGLNHPIKENLPALVTTGQEVIDALGENAKRLQFFVRFIMDNKFAEQIIATLQF